MSEIVALNEVKKDYLDILEKMIEPLDWADFQAIPDGNIHYYNEHTGIVTFHYRIGLHMKRPMETIMARGNFIRFRMGSPHYNGYALERLDPENVNSCLYEGYQVNTERFSRSWQPVLHNRHTLQQNALLQQQLAQQNALLNHQHALQQAQYQNYQNALHNPYHPNAYQNAYPNPLSKTTGILTSGGSGVVTSSVNDPLASIGGCVPNPFTP